MVRAQDLLTIPFMYHGLVCIVTILISVSAFARTVEPWLPTVAYGSQTWASTNEVKASGKFDPALYAELEPYIKHSGYYHLFEKVMERRGIKTFSGLANTVFRYCSDLPTNVRGQAVIGKQSTIVALKNFGSSEYSYADWAIKRMENANLIHDEHLENGIVIHRVITEGNYICISPGLPRLSTVLTMIHEAYHLLFADPFERFNLYEVVNSQDLQEMGVAYSGGEIEARQVEAIAFRNIKANTEFSTESEEEKFIGNDGKIKDKAKFVNFLVADSSNFTAYSSNGRVALLTEYTRVVYITKAIESFILQLRQLANQTDKNSNHLREVAKKNMEKHALHGSDSIKIYIETAEKQLVRAKLQEEKAAYFRAQIGTLEVKLAEYNDKQSYLITHFSELISTKVANR